MHSSIGIDIAAPPELVFRLARDVERWPRLLPHYSDVQVEDRFPDGSVVARLVARRPLVAVLGVGLPVAWRSRSWSEPAGRRLRFIHRGGATHGMDVTWHIEARVGGTRVTIEHEFQPRIGAWAAIVDRLFTRPIAGRTLATFAALAEALATEPEARFTTTDPSEPSAGANLRT
jgi:ribosome-associated toxin RatA of RatAB toxin-antitoxin module